MKERGILMSAPMARAVLAGTKTQTRRIAPIASLNIKPLDADTLAWSVRFSKPVKGVLASHSGGRFSEVQARSIVASMFGNRSVPGDRLWVREAWSVPPFMDRTKPSDLAPTCLGTVRYKADGHQSGRLRPGMFMPRWASRITLEVTEVSVERLQDISEADCRAEGCNGGHGSIPGYQYSATPQEHFRAVWQAINGPDSWSVNPFVWCVSFRRSP